MTKINFDTLEYAGELVEAGFKKAQAEAVTKATIKATRQIFEGLDLASKSDIECLRSTTRENITNLRFETKKDITDLKVEMTNFKVEIQKTMLKMFISTIGILGALQTFLKFYPGHL